MMWRLEMKPSKWQESLSLPLMLPEPQTLMLENDPADLGDLLDDVLYAIQRTQHTVDMLTRHPVALLSWMQADRVRYELVARSNVRWGVAFELADEAPGAIAALLRFPVRERWVLAPPEINLSPWEPHEFSTVGHAGVCEDCGVGKHETKMHDRGAQPIMRRVDANTKPSASKRPAQEPVRAAI